MNHKTFTYNKDELTRNKSYITSIYGYTKENSGALIYNGAYILESEFQRLSTIFPDISSMIADAFCIPLTLNENNTFSIEKEDIEKIQQQINNTKNEIKEIFEQDSEQIDEENTSIDYEWTVYNLIQHLGMILEDDGFDVETKLSFQNNLDELEKSLQYFLNKDLTATIEKYNNNPKSTTDPLIRQIMFIHRRLENFIKTLPSDVKLSISMWHQWHFNDIKTNALLYLRQKYQQDWEKDISTWEIDHTIESKFTNAINQLRIAIFQLNYIFETPDEQKDGSKIHKIHPFVNKLFDQLFKYIGSIERKPESQKEFDTINDNISEFIVIFIQDAYEWLSKKEQLKEMHNITRNLGDTIHNAVEEILEYKKYELLSQEYKFIKDILVSLQQAHINNWGNEENEEISQRFTSLLELDTSFHKTLKPEDLKTLITLSTHYEKYALLVKLQNNNIITKPS